MLLDQLFDLKSKVTTMSSDCLLPNFISVPCIRTKPFIAELPIMLQEQELQDLNKDLRKKVTSMTLLKHLYVCIYVCTLMSRDCLDPLLFRALKTLEHFSSLLRLKALL
jgi:hypothetical protein